MTETGVQLSGDFWGAAEVLLYGLSASSQRQYRHTFACWRDFAEAQGFAVSDLRPLHLIAFLESGDLSHSTKTSRLAHLRKLLQALHAAHPGDLYIKSLYEQARLLKVQRSATEKQVSRVPVALTPEQIYRALAVWDGDLLRERRNKALLVVLLYGGLRRSEASGLAWDDLDLGQRLLHVRHGKGDQARTIPLLGGQTALRALERWRVVSEGRRYVFCGIRKGDHLDLDAPMTSDGVYRVIQETAELAGLDFSPHDARRTLLTNGLAAGSSVADMQFLAGHRNPQTTLRYAVVKDADEVRGRVKLNY